MQNSTGSFGLLEQGGNNQLNKNTNQNSFGLVEQQLEQQQYQTPHVPFHLHTGVDAPKIDFSNLTFQKRFSTIPVNPTFPSPVKEGTLISKNGVLYYYNGTTWVTFDIKAQQSYNHTFTTTTTVGITTPFVPQQIVANGFVVDVVDSPATYGTTNGFAGVTDPITGLNTFLDFKYTPGAGTSATMTTEYGNGTNLLGNTHAFCYVSAWSSTGVALTTSVTANWSLGINLMITG